MLRAAVLALVLASTFACSEQSSTSSSGGASGSGSSGGSDAGGSFSGGAPSGGSAGTGAAGAGGVGGDAAVDATASSAVPSIHPSDPHLFVRNNQLWYPAGYYPGTAVNMTGSDYSGDSVSYMTAFIDLAAASGIDLFRIWLNWGNVDDPSGGTWDAHINHPYQRTGPGVAFDGKPKVDVTKFDPKYFSDLETIVDYAGQKGIVVQAMLLDCWHVGFGLASGFKDRDYFSAKNNVNGVSWDTEAEWLSPSGQVFQHNAVFVEKVVETIGDRENLIWETCNEKKQGDHSTYAASSQDPFHVAVANVVRAREQALGFPRHLVIPVDLPEHRTVAGHRTPTNGGSGQESIAAMRARLIDPQLSWNVPLISDNDCCPGEPDAAFVRQKAWAAFTALSHVDVFNNELFKKSVLSNTNTKNGMRWVGYTQQLVKSLGVSLAHMSPHDELATNGAWVLARPGDEYVVYLASGGSTTLTSLPAKVSATWFNPRTAATSAAGAGPTFTAPDTKDWVLHVVGQ